MDKQTHKCILWSRLFTAYLLFLLILPACQPEVGIPTLAVAAVVPPTSTPLPPTWTPSPLKTADSPQNHNFAQLDPLAATPPPSTTPLFSTYTPRPTSTPLPSDTPPPAPPNLTYYKPYIPILPPTDELGPSKLGLHVIRNNDAWIMEFVRQGQPAVIKALDDFGYLPEVKAVSPRTIVVGRINTPDQNYAGVPEQAAWDFVQLQLSQYQANPAVDYWEGWNEPDPNLDNMPWYARFEQERVRLLATYGFKAAVGGFATGVPEMDEFALFLPAIETAKQYQGILTLHEYGAPDMTYLYGAGLPGYPSYPDRGALAFRYRWYYRELLEPRNLVVPLVITEAGIDGIIGDRPGPQGYGWADFQNYWIEQGWGDNGVDAFINQLAWYDAGVRQDGYVIGFTVFTAGPIGHWRNYDINPILPDLTAYVIGQQ